MKLAGALLLLAAMNAGLLGGEDTDPPAPGKRLLVSAEFAARKPNDQNWALRAIESAEKGLVPRMKDAQSVVVYSLDPTHLDDIRMDEVSRTHFHGFRILGRTTVWREEVLNGWRRTFVEGLIPAEMLLCFEPRHAVRIHTRTSTIDMVLCFECGKMRTYGWQPDKETHACFFDSAVRDWLNALLDSQQIRRSIPAGPNKRD